MDGRQVVVVASAGVAVLAIGVVLGSGPLRTSLLGGAGEELAALEAEVSEAESQTAEAEDAAQAGREYLEGVAPVLLGGLMPEAQVLVIDLGGEGAEPVSDGIVLTGATVAGTVTLGSEWTAADQAPFRAALADQVAATVEGIEGDTPDEVLAHAFIQGATGGQAEDISEGGIDASGTDRGAVLWDLLTQAGLASGDPAAGVDAVILAIGDGEGEGEVLAGAAVASRLPLVVVGSPSAVASFEGSDEVATVGATDWTYGSVTAAATLAEAAAGTIGHHRIGEGQAQVPDVIGTFPAPTTSGD